LREKKLFREGDVEAGGVRIRYMESGEGIPLVHLQGASGLRLTPAHDILCRHFRVVAFEMPGFGHLPASTMAQAIKNLGLDTFNLMGTSSGGETALWLALHAPARVLALVLEAPAAIRRKGDCDADLESRLPHLATPTLALFGTRDDVIPPTMGRFYKELMPNCHLVFVYDAGHAISTDRPEAFADVVVDFLERHEAFVISRAQTVIHP
jgi:abhydrolase domain-containing protein 14